MLSPLTHSLTLSSRPRPKANSITANPEERRQDVRRARERGREGTGREVKGKKWKATATLAVELEHRTGKPEECGGVELERGEKMEARGPCAHSLTYSLLGPQG